MRGHVPRRPEGDLAAVAIQEEDAVGERQERLEAVLDDHDRPVAARRQVGQALEHGHRARRVQVGGRLVEDEEARQRRQDVGQGEALLLAARQGARGTRLEAGQAHLREGRRDGRQHPVAVPATVLQPEGDLVGNVRHHELRFGILEDEADLPAKDARRRARHLVVTDEQRAGPRAGQGVRHDPRQRAGERALAAPRWADDEQQLAGVQREADVVEGRAGPARVRPAEPVRANGWWGHAPPGKVSRTPVRRSAFRSHQPSSPASTMPEMTSTTAIVACTSSPNLSGG